MKKENEKRSRTRMRWLLGGVPAALLLGATATAVHHSGTSTKAGQTPEAQAGFYCNVKALTAMQRAQHRLLTEKLLAARKATVELENGYDFQYQAGTISLGELANWVVMESKCCPFFDFHIDLEERGRVLCLRLTGKEGVKRFIRAEFGLDSK